MSDTTDQDVYSPEEQAIIDAGQRERPEPAPQRDRQEPRQNEGEQRDNPHGNQAMAEMRRRAEAAERAAQTERESRIAFEARADERFRRLEGIGKPAEPKLPDFAEDPTGHLSGRQNATDAELKQLREWREGQEQAAQRLRDENAVLSWGQSQEAEFKTRTPDYVDAFNHLAKSRGEEMTLVGIPPAHQQAVFRADMLTMIEGARQAGVNPAERIYALAKLRGFAGKAAAAPQADPEEARIDREARGQTFAASPTSGAAPAKGMPSGNDVAQMSDEEFEKFFESKQGRQMYGRA